MKTAKKMFEEWGYNVVKEWQITVPKTQKIRKGILYKKDDGGRIDKILFNPVFKRVDFDEYEEYNYNLPTGKISLYVEQFTAIHQQMKELGWLDE